MMQTNYKPGYDSETERRAIVKSHSREAGGEWLFRLFVFGALFSFLYGGLTFLQTPAHSVRFYDGPLYFGLGAATYLIGWCIRFLITGSRGLF